jgi:hypothetical protein
VAPGRLVGYASSGRHNTAAYRMLLDCKPTRVITAADVTFNESEWLDSVGSGNMAPAPAPDGKQSSDNHRITLSPGRRRSSHPARMPDRSVPDDFLASVELDHDVKAFDMAAMELCLKHGEVNVCASQFAPKALQEALGRPDADLRQTAMTEELAALQSKQVYTPGPLGPGIRPIGTRLVFALKLRPDASIERDLKETVYVHYPPGVDVGMIWILHKALYGLKQATHAWHTFLWTLLGKLGYHPCRVDPAIFIRKRRTALTAEDTGTVCVIFTHVDDTAATGPKTEGESYYASILQEVEGRNLEEEIDGQVFLGKLHTRDSKARIITISQPLAIEALLTRHGLNGNVPPVRKPLEPHIKLCHNPEDSCDSPAVKYFAAIVGGLMYFANTTRPDISFAASALACFMSKPTDELNHVEPCEACGSVLGKYWQVLGETCLVLGAAEQRDCLHGVDSDSNCADDIHTFRSVAGIAVLYGKPLLLWRSVKMLDIGAKSTASAEYIAASMASEVMFTQSILSELGMLVPTTDLCVDSDAATMILEKPRVDHKTKYLCLHCDYVQERVPRNEIRVVWVPTNENAADLFTKSLGGQ